jgi:lipopolysaccharide/colanic/teichoic acid biosynthesis glycosyltransferase
MIVQTAKRKPEVQPARSRPRHGRCEPSAWYGRVKRLTDIAVAGAALAAAAPLLAGCALWIWLADGGPVFYRQWRVGRDGWLFPIYKLRTMTRDAERAEGPRFAERDDQRVLRGCGWMRRSHVDELPQLWNILLGQMSVVGPRPERPQMMRTLGRRLPRLHERLAGAPGLTGLAQVRNGYTNDVAGARRKLALDLKYLRTRSVWNDLKLIVRTVPKVWDKAAM